MKNKHFFIENGKEVEIKNFDYDYVLNSLAKEYRSDLNRKYMYTIIIDRTYDALGNPVFDVRKLDLNEMYFDTVRLRVLKLMMDDIMLDKYKHREMPKPAIYQEYEDWVSGKTAKKMAPPVVANIPEYVRAERVVIEEDDPRIAEVRYFASGPDGIAGTPIKAVDWIQNYELCNHELAVEAQAISQRKIELASAIKDNSEYLETVFKQISTAMETLFPLKPTFIQRIMGNTPEMIPREKDMNAVLATLRNASTFDPKRFEGIKLMFQEINDDMDLMNENIQNGSIACAFQIAKVEDKFEWELGEQRLEKVAVTNGILKASLIADRNKFMVNMNRMQEIQTILIPLVVDRVQNNIGQKLDSETENAVRILAYGYQESSSSAAPAVPAKPEEDY